MSICYAVILTVMSAVESLWKESYLLDNAAFVGSLYQVSEQQDP